MNNPYLNNKFKFYKYGAAADIWQERYSFLLQLLDYDMVNSIFEVAAINLGGPHQIDKMGLMKAYETVLRDSSKQ